MRLKYRLKEMVRFLRFAFYPRITLITCFLITVLLNLFYFAMMRFLPDNFAYDELLFALVTGATASFFVTLVVELSGNYKSNKLAWYELQSYYEIVIEYESMKHILMKQSPHQRAERMRKETLETKKMFLTDAEIFSLQGIMVISIIFAVKSV